MLMFNKRIGMAVYFEEYISENFCIVSDFNSGNYYVENKENLIEFECKDNLLEKNNNLS